MNKVSEKTVKPFSNATEAMMWKERNCDRCDKYECESTSESEAGCVPAYYVDLGFLVGEISENIAEQVGWDEGILTQCKLIVGQGS